MVFAIKSALPEKEGLLAFLMMQLPQKIRNRYNYRHKCHTTYRPIIGTLKFKALSADRIARKRQCKPHRNDRDIYIAASDMAV